MGGHLPGSGLRKTPAPCRGPLAQGHVGSPAREGLARLPVPSGVRPPGARAGACSPHLHTLRTAPHGQSGPWAGSCAAGPLPTAPLRRHKLSILGRAPPRPRITHSFRNDFPTKPQVRPLGERLSRSWGPPRAVTPQGSRRAWASHGNVEGELSGQTTQEPDQGLKPAEQGCQRGADRAQT